MKAVRMHRYGGPDVLIYEDAPRPTPAADDVLVKVHAAGVNLIDRLTRAGFLQQVAQFTLPFVPGLDVAGVVAEVGENVKGVKAGDAVYGFTSMARQGAYAEYAVVHASELGVKPQTIDFVSSAAVPLAGLTAWQGLFEHGQLLQGQTVLIHGAGGGVGSFAVQFARAKGARVIGTAATDKQELLHELGVEQAIDYTTTRFEDVARDVDLVFDTAGGDVVPRSFEVLKAGGALVTLSREPHTEAAAARGLRAQTMAAHPDSAQLADIAGLIDQGRVRPVVSLVVPLADARQAHEQLEAGHLRGKIVLQVMTARGE